MPTSYHDGSQEYSGYIRANQGLFGPIARSNVIATPAVFNIPIQSWTKTDGAALAASVPANGSTFFGIASVDFAGIDKFTLITQDHDAANAAVSIVARNQFILPYNYVDASAIVVRLNAGMITTAATNIPTILPSVFLTDAAAFTVGSDLTTTAAQNVTSTTPANFDFAVTSTGFVAGSVLELKITCALDPDTAAAASGWLAIPHTQIVCYVR
jgi:hypothetical protein